MTVKFKRFVNCETERCLYQLMSLKLHQLHQFQMQDYLK